MNKKTGLEILRDGASTIISRNPLFDSSYRAIANGGGLRACETLEKLESKYTMLYFDISSLGSPDEHVNCLIDMLLIRQMLSNHKIGEFKNSPLNLIEDKYTHILNCALYDRAYRNPNVPDNYVWSMGVKSFHETVEARVQKFIDMKNVDELFEVYK